MFFQSKAHRYKIVQTFCMHGFFTDLSNLLELEIKALAICIRAKQIVSSFICAGRGLNQYQGKFLFDQPI